MVNSYIILLYTDINRIVNNNTKYLIHRIIPTINHESVSITDRFDVYRLVDQKLNDLN